MFERYTEKARRVIFFSRYEASNYGSPKIDTDHLLLGLFREDKTLYRWMPKTKAEDLRLRVDQNSHRKEWISTSVDLPLSESSKRVSHAANEADRSAQKHIGTEHLLLGLLDEENCFAAKVLRECGADAAQIRQYYADRPERPTLSRPVQQAPYVGLGFRALSKETVEIHGARWNVDYVRDIVKMLRAYNWHWEKEVWRPRDVVIHKKTGRVSFDLGLAASDPENFSLVKDGWKKDHCFICRWELFEVANDAEHGSGYTNGHDWLCSDCYTKFWDRPDFFSSSYSDIT